MHFLKRPWALKNKKNHIHHQKHGIYQVQLDQELKSNINLAYSAIAHYSIFRLIQLGIYISFYEPLKVCN